jgi:hypothetical protein
MFRLIGIIVVVIGIYLVCMTYQDIYETHVYSCSDTDLPPDVRQKCRQLVKQPKMDEKGCVIQQTPTGDLKTCG